MLWSRYWRPVRCGVLGMLLLSALVGAGQTTRLAASSGVSAAKTFTNPVYPHNFPDPSILKLGKTYYGYGTGTCDQNFQLVHSKDLVDWTAAKDPMPNLPSWAMTDCVQFFQNRMSWAPEVLRLSGSKYVMYYVARWKATKRQCLGHAISKSPDGPFVDGSKKPFICQTGLGGSIDPYPFRDRGKLYLYWKNDGNCCGMLTHIWARGMSKDGMKVLGKQASVEVNNELWEGDLTEAPAMWRHGRTYYLFYSANFFASSSYAVGYARCKSPLGPCRDARENPILHSRCRAVGPGGETITTDAKGRTWIAYHAWLPHHVGDTPGGPGREMWIDRLDWKKGKPVVHGPTCKAQEDPAT